ncbi:MAG: DUF1592 domain-containing protein, partial [Verrucomicrobiota bacterium]
LKAGEPFETSLRLPLLAILISPRFLFRVETQPDGPSKQGVYPLDEFAIASRLSYFLWSSMPDDELLELARSRTLKANLDHQIERMLRDAKAEKLTRNFAGQWLQLRNMELIDPDPQRFPAFNEALKTAMVKETEALFQHMIDEDRSLFELLEADYTFVNRDLARHYGMPEVKGGGFEKVSLKKTGRAGLLTHGSILTLTSNPTRTSPVKRGKWILENMLGTPPPPPAPDTPDLDEQSEELKGLSFRERLEQHRDHKSCATCHALMDPIGFGLEQFDAVGAWREKDGTFDIDASGRLVTGESFDGARALRTVLTESRRKDFAVSFIRALMTYGLGRGLDIEDRCAIDRVYRESESHDFRFSQVVKAIVKSPTFLMSAERRPGHEKR